MRLLLLLLAGLGGVGGGCCCSAVVAAAVGWAGWACKDVDTRAETDLFVHVARVASPPVADDGYSNTRSCMRPSTAQLTQPGRLSGHSTLTGS